MRDGQANLIDMATFDVIVHVSPLPGVLDPAAAAVTRALPALGFNTVSDTQIGKVITFRFESNNEYSANEEVTKMCESLLANPVIEVYSISVTPSESLVQS